MIILIIPIGAPGSGKTTLKNHLKDILPNFYTTERDEEFAKLYIENKEFDEYFKFDIYYLFVRN